MNLCVSALYVVIEDQCFKSSGFKLLLLCRFSKIFVLVYSILYYLHTDIFFLFLLSLLSLKSANDWLATSC